MRYVPRAEAARPSPPASRGTSALRVIVASVGVVLILLGLVLLSIDVSRANEAKAWRWQTLYDFLTSRAMDRLVVLGDIADWLRHPRYFLFLNAPIVFILEMIPQSIALIALGGMIVWRGLKG